MCGYMCNIMCVILERAVTTMATNLEIDNDLMNEALKLGGHKTKRGVVEEALEEYVQRRKQKEIVKLFGTIDYEKGYDYKKQRKKK